MVDIALDRTWKGAWSQATGWMFIGAVAGAVIGVLLSLFAIYNIGLSGLLGTLVMGFSGTVIFGLCGLVMGVMDYWLPEKIKSLANWVFILLIIFALVSAVVIMQRAGTLPEYLKFASPLWDGLQKGLQQVAKFRYCLYADPQCPLFVSPWDPAIQSSEEVLQVSVSFDEKKIKPDDTVNLLVNLAVTNPKLDILTIKPRCYFKSKNESDGGRELTVENMGTYSEGDVFKFPLTRKDEELHASFRCVGEVPEAAGKNVYSEDVIVELERPVAVETNWLVWIGSEPRKGVVRSEMKYNAPYIVGIGSSNDMPFEEGKKYAVQVSLKRRDDTVKFKRLESIVISYPDQIMLDCLPLFIGTDHEIEFKDADYNALKTVAQYNAEQENFIFPCSLYVSEAGKEAQLAPIEMQSSYTVYSDYKARIFKTP
jgi:hypothetical protein